MPCAYNFIVDLPNPHHDHWQWQSSLWQISGTYIAPNRTSQYAKRNRALKHYYGPFEVLQSFVSSILFVLCIVCTFRICACCYVPDTVCRIADLCSQNSANIEVYLRVCGSVRPSWVVSFQRLFAKFIKSLLCDMISPGSFLLNWKFA